MSQHGCPERLSNRSKGFQEDGPSQPTMEVLVETLTGTAFEMTVSPSDTVFAIKSKIFRVEGIPVSQQHLLYNLKELEDSMSLRELAITDGARLRLVLGMRGGPVSTRRLPPPAPVASEPWPDIERLLDSNRDDIEWTSSGCKVTVLVFRDGERVNMLRVKENSDGTYSPIDSNKFSGVASAPERAEGAVGAGGAAGARRDNSLTQTKMAALRRRMEALALQRAPHVNHESSVEMQKTRSEETLPTRAPDDPRGDDCFAVYDNNYTRYAYECGFESRYTLLPAVGAEPERADAEPAPRPQRPRRQSRREGEEAAILEECLAGEECLRAHSPRPAPRLQPLPTDYGGVVGGVPWRGGHSASALQLRAGGAAAGGGGRRPPLRDALFSSSTSDLENLKRNSRILPALSRARPREHLHLSDEGLHLRRDAPTPEGLQHHAPEGRQHEGRQHEGRQHEGRQHEGHQHEGRQGEAPERRDRRIEKIAELDGRLGRFADAMKDQDCSGDVVKEKKIRVRCALCRKRLSVATVHRCRCGAAYCAPHRYAEVHGCAYDYKGGAPAPASVLAPRLPRI